MKRNSLWQWVQRVVRQVGAPRTNADQAAPRFHEPLELRELEERYLPAAFARRPARQTTPADPVQAVVNEVAAWLPPEPKPEIREDRDEPKLNVAVLDQLMAANPFAPLQTPSQPAVRRPLLRTKHTKVRRHAQTTAHRLPRRSA